MITDNAGPVDIEVPRDRNGTFEPGIVIKHQRRLNGGSLVTYDANGSPLP